MYSKKANDCTPGLEQYIQLENSVMTMWQDQVTATCFMYVGITFLFCLLLCYWYHRSKNLPPGPRGLPIVGTVPFAGKFLARTLRKWAAVYGPIMTVRFGKRDVITLNDYQSVNEAFVKNSELCSGRVVGDIIDVFNDQGYGLLFADYGPFWKSQRKFGLTTLRGFGVGRKSMEEKVLEEVAYLNNEILRYEENPFDIMDHLANAVSNNICNVLFGSRFEYDDIRFTNAVHHLSRGVGDTATTTLVKALFLLPFLADIPPFSTKLKAMQDDFAKTEAVVQQIIDEHKHTFDANNPRDLIDAFLVEMDKSSDPSFTEHQLLKLCHNLFFAGTETTTSTLRWGILCMLHYPETQKKIHKEISETIGTETVVAMSDRTKMPYTCAFIQELYRFRTLVPLSIGHKTTDNMMLKGYVIPKNTKVLANLWAVHNDPHIWEEPESFVPERHLDCKGCFVKSKHVIPFSIGPRHCLGEQLARMEIFIFLVSLLQKFEFHPSPDDAILPEINEGSFAGVYVPLRYNVVAKQK